MDQLNEMERLFEAMTKLEASDLHLKTGSAPLMRISGAIRNLDTPPLTNEQASKLIQSISSERKWAEFEERGDTDFSYTLPDGNRFRVNVYMERSNIAMAARRVNMNIPSFEDLHLKAKTMVGISRLEQGLVLLAGVTGSGKSTTLAALIEHINRNRRCHIVTVEDPIEYVFKDQKAFVNQREVGEDVQTFPQALKMLMRQDPDVILVGEMRDQDTFSFALSAAETGHLVFSTIHAGNCPQTISRILDMYPKDRHAQIRNGLFFNLKGVICQKLLPAKDPKIGRVAVQEIMVASPIIRKYIQEGSDEKIPEVLQSLDRGMQDFNTGLKDLLDGDMITKEVALEHSPNAEALNMLLSGIKVSSKSVS